MSCIVRWRHTKASGQATLSLQKWYPLCSMKSSSPFVMDVLLVTLDLGCQISLGDVQSNYLLTTAENELGVVVAHSEAGEGAFNSSAL